MQSKNNENLEDRILKVVSDNPNITFVNLARKLKVKYTDNKNLTFVINNLINNNLLSIDRRNNTYSALKKIGIYEGIIRFASEGKFAFIDTDDIDTEGKNVSYFIPSIYFLDAMNEDLVNVDVYQLVDQNNQKPFGMVQKVLERKTNNVVGILNNKGNYLTFKPIDKFCKNFEFRIVDCIKEARILDIVVAEIVSHKSKYKEVKIVKKITNGNDPMAYVKSLEFSRNVPEEFPQEVLDYVEKNIPDDIYKEDLTNRLDLRNNELIVTIDGADTKDYDDAISVKKIDENHYELGVHIADVAYYVKQDSILDNEALKRGTSIYLVDKVVPMLPLKLSNGICSLNPNVDRLTISCISVIDNKGNTISTKVVPSIINSKYRLTYDRVNQFILQNSLFGIPELDKMLDNAYKLSKIIRNYKSIEGYIDFEIEEPKIVLDKDGRVLDITIKPSSEAEKLIEDFMVRANEEVAKYITSKKLPMMYRVHEIPDNEKIEYFLNVLKLLKINVNFDTNKITPITFQKIVEEINKQKSDDFLKMLFLRTMQKAVYSADNVGHFGLASSCYCHFTSPIRRYPDVIVHRILWDFVFNNNLDKINDFSSKLESIASQNSLSEQNAVQIERDTNDLKFAEYYKSRINVELEGQIFTITKFGVFLQFPNKTVAMIHLSNISDGEFKPNESKTELISEKDPKEKYVLGQFVRVVIIAADETSGKVDAVLLKDYKKYLNKVKNNLVKKQENKNAKQR